ncbi:hypothetical protein L1049_020444 [Liquidambar formosana]|uniref:non-specific serine/threonine protein kinase n=1 Tax=Liquidambar formosana TaxID=63359 RepID=A0AAP0SD45_LIQFO
MDRRLLSRNNFSEIEMNAGKHEHQVVISDQWSSKGSGLSGTSALRSIASDLNSLSNVRLGNMFTLREIEDATNGLADDNVIGNGDYGVVYRGVFWDHRQVAVKKLQFNSCQAEDFKKEVEAIGQVRHKNLVRLIGYCIEGDYRMLVYEYVNNGNLHQWLHGRVGRVSPLTWGIRMNIIVGTAKGLAYLHEDIEPKVVHQAIKSSNILLDHKWNPKISDFGLASLFDPQDSNETTRAIKTSSYIAPGYASTGLTKKSDMYSFGILIMETISGRTPIDYSKPQEEVYLIDWLKSMVANQKSDHVLDPKIQQRPTSKELKRVLLIALRCVDPDAKNRPKMGDVIHMLQPCDLLLSDRHCKRRETYHRSYPQGSEAVENIGEDAFDTNEGESSSNHPQKMMST